MLGLTVVVIIMMFLNIGNITVISKLLILFNLEKDKCILIVSLTMENYLNRSLFTSRGNWLNLSSVLKFQGSRK